MTSPTDPREQRLLALALLLPAALLAWPAAGAPLAHDPFPHLAGSGWIALAALPGVGLAAWRGRLAGGMALGLLALLLVAGALSAWLGEATDRVELRRAAVHGGAVLGLFSAGAGLTAVGRAVLVRGLVLLSLAWTAGAWFGGEGLQGVLGNTGALSQAALPGAICGAWLAASEARSFRVLGGLALVAFALHAGRAPVLVGLLACGGALILSASFGRAVFTRGARAFLLIAAALLPTLWLGLRVVPASGDDEQQPLVSADTGGVAVRLAIWASVPTLLADHPLFGVGPGQVQAAFPPYRDPREIAASSHDSCEDHATEVDHLHNDVLEGLAETGLVGGLAWLGLLGLVALRGLAALRDAERERGALGAASLALLACALAHSPLLLHPASAALGFVMFGALCAPSTGAGSPWARLCLAPALLAAAGGWALIKHGRELTASLLGRAELHSAVEGGSSWDPALAGEWERFSAALRALPGSVPALYFQDDFLRATGEPAGERVGVLEEILVRRPHDLRAHQELALLALKRDGDAATARAHWETALALDPGHPRVLRNLVNLALDSGDARTAATYIARLEELGCLDPAWLKATAIRLCFDGRGDLALGLLSPGDERFAARSGGMIHALSKEAEARGQADLAYGLESVAHHLWAREHVGLSDFPTAVRSYRQALRPTHSRHESGAPLLRLEMAAAQLLAGDEAGARAGIEGMDRSPAVESSLPAWAREALIAAGL